MVQSTNVAKEDLVGSELIRYIIETKIPAMKEMIILHSKGQLPGIRKEVAKGENDDKGAIFIHGGFVHEKQTSRGINKLPHGNPQDLPKIITEYLYVRPTLTSFRESIKAALKYDCATLLYPKGIAYNVHIKDIFQDIILDWLNGARDDRRTRVREFSPKALEEYDLTGILKSYAPPIVSKEDENQLSTYGARRIAAAPVAACLTNPVGYYKKAKRGRYLSLSKRDADEFIIGIEQALKPIVSSGGHTLSNSPLVLCHTERTLEYSLVGLIEIMYGKFGEFATLSLEPTRAALVTDLCVPAEYTQENAFARFQSKEYVLVLRTYPPTNPGSRSKRERIMLVTPEDLKLKSIVVS